MLGSTFWYTIALLTFSTSFSYREEKEGLFKLIDRSCSTSWGVKGFVMSMSSENLPLLNDKLIKKKKNSKCWIGSFQHRRNRDGCD